MELLRVYVPFLDILATWSQWVHCSSSFHPGSCNSVSRWCERTVSKRRVCCSSGYLQPGVKYLAAISSTLSGFLRLQGVCPQFVSKAEAVFVRGQPNYFRFILACLVSRITLMLVMSFSVGQTWTWCCSLWQEGETQKLPETSELFNTTTPSSELGTLRYPPKQRTVCMYKKTLCFGRINVGVSSLLYMLLPFHVKGNLVQRALLPEPRARRYKLMLSSWVAQPAPEDISPAWWKGWLCPRTGSVSCNLYSRVFSDVFLKTNLGHKLFKIKLR